MSPVAEFVKLRIRLCSQTNEKVWEPLFIDESERGIPRRGRWAISPGGAMLDARHYRKDAVVFGKIWRQVNNDRA